MLLWSSYSTLPRWLLAVQLWDRKLVKFYLKGHFVVASFQSARFRARGHTDIYLRSIFYSNERSIKQYGVGGGGGGVAN